MKFAGKLMPLFRQTLPRGPGEWAAELLPNVIGAGATALMAPAGASGMERLAMGAEDGVTGALLDFGLRAGTYGALGKGYKMLNQGRAMKPEHLSTAALVGSTSGSMGLYMTGMVPRPIANSIYEREMNEAQAIAEAEKRAEVEALVAHELERRMNPVAANLVEPYATMNDEGRLSLFGIG